jgi:hypothetical protein
VNHASTNTLDKPVLDQEMFQQLLAAAHTLQEQNDHRLVKGAKAGYPAVPSVGSVAQKVQWITPILPPPAHLEAEPEPPLKLRFPRVQSDAGVPDLAPEVGEATTFKPPLSKSSQFATPRHHWIPMAPSASRDRMLRRRISQSNEVFWRVATVVAMAAVAALLLSAAVDRLSPLPAGLALPPEVVQQQVPFQEAQPIVTPVPQTGAVGTNNTATRTSPTEPDLIADQPAGKIGAPASWQKTTSTRNRHSAYESEVDIVAPNTVVRYDARSSRAQVHNKP